MSKKQVFWLTTSLMLAVNLAVGGLVIMNRHLKKKDIVIDALE